MATLTIKLDGSGVRAGVQEASGLARSAVGEEVRVTDRRSDACSDDLKSRSVGVQRLDISCIGSIQSTSGIVDVEQRTGWIETENHGDPAALDILADESQDVSCHYENQKQLLATRM